LVRLTGESSGSGEHACLDCGHQWIGTARETWPDIVVSYRRRRDDH
jgi:hypothetical protein